MEKTIELPQKYIDMVGTEMSLGGGLFSNKKDLPFEKYNILDWRWGSGKIVDMKTKQPKHPTVEFLVKKEGMKRSRWTRGFAVREIKLSSWD